MKNSFFLNDRWHQSRGRGTIKEIDSPDIRYARNR